MSVNQNSGLSSILTYIVVEKPDLRFRNFSLRRFNLYLGTYQEWRQGFAAEKRLRPHHHPHAGALARVERSRVAELLRRCLQPRP